MKLFTKGNLGTNLIKFGSDRNVCVSRLIKTKDVFHFQISFQKRNNLLCAVKI